MSRAAWARGGSGKTPRAGDGRKKKRETLLGCFPLLAFLESVAVRNHAKGKGYDSQAWRAVQGKALWESDENQFLEHTAS